MYRFLIWQLATTMKTAPFTLYPDATDPLNPHMPYGTPAGPCGCLPMIIGLVFFGLGAGVALFGMALFVHQNWLYNTRSTWTTGKVQSCTVNNVREEPSSIYVSYTYQVDGTAYSTFKQLQFKHCDDHMTNAAIRIQYLSNSPAVSRLEGEQAPFALPALAAAFTGALGLAGLMVWQMIQSQVYVRRQRRLRGGTLTLDGKIVSVRREQRWRSRAHYLVVTYRFTTLDGREVTRKAEAFRPDMIHSALPAAGTPVTVLYADDHAVTLR
ncbi:MAG: hypothetical protein OHK0046_34440 [Anaerolineae bacterium]